MPGFRGFVDMRRGRRYPSPCATGSITASISPVDTKPLLNRVGFSHCKAWDAALYFQGAVMLDRSIVPKGR